MAARSGPAVLVPTNSGRLDWMRSSRPHSEWLVPVAGAVHKEYRVYVADTGRVYAIYGE